MKFKILQNPPSHSFLTECAFVRCKSAFENYCSSHGNQLYSIWQNNRFRNRLKLIEFNVFMCAYAYAQIVSCVKRLRGLSFSICRSSTKPVLFCIAPFCLSAHQHTQNSNALTRTAQFLLYLAYLFSFFSLGDSFSLNIYFNISIQMWPLKQ